MPDPSDPFSHGPPPNPLARPSREDGFGETVVRQVCQVLDDPVAAVAAMRRLHRDRTGRPGLSCVDLVAARFPADLRPVWTPPATPARVFEAFATTTLGERWEKVAGDCPDWGPAGRRALAFHWVTWGVMVVHDMEWPEPPGPRLTIPGPGGTIYYVERLIPWAVSLGWTGP